MTYYYASVDSICDKLAPQNVFSSRRGHLNIVLLKAILPTMWFWKSPGQHVA